MADDLSAALAEIRERERKASPGPWKVTREHGHDMDDAPWSLPSVTGPDGRDILLGSVDQPGPDLRFAACAREDVPRLLAAVEAALRHHQPVPLYGNASTEDEPAACPHNPDRDWDCHFESDDGEWLCELKPEGTVCSGCPGLPDGERIPWPCDEYTAILAALAGEGEPGD